MNPLVKNLMEQANLDEAVAGKVADIVAKFLEDKLPAPANSMAAKAVRGLDIDDMAEGAMDKIGDMF